MKKHTVLATIALTAILSLTAVPAHAITAVVAEPTPPTTVITPDDLGDLGQSLGPATGAESWYCLLIRCKVKR